MRQSGVSNWTTGYFRLISPTPIKNEHLLLKLGLNVVYFQIVFPKGTEWFCQIKWVPNNLSILAFLSAVGLKQVQVKWALLK